MDCIHSREVWIKNAAAVAVLTMPRRVCAMHGLPVSIAMSEVNAAQPSECLPLRPMDRIDTLPNVLAMIGLTSILEEARDSMYVRSPVYTFPLTMAQICPQKIITEVKRSCSYILTASAAKAAGLLAKSPRDSLLQRYYARGSLVPIQRTFGSNIPPNTRIHWTQLYFHYT